MTPESGCAAAWAAVLMACSLVACDAGLSGEKDGASTRSQDSTAAPSDAEVFFPTMPEQDALPTALTRGELALDGKGCLRTTRNADAGPQDLVPIWPSTSEPDTSGGEVRMLDGERVVALVGKVVEIGVRDRRWRWAVARRAPKKY